jgi:hypothetical protein
MEPGRKYLVLSLLLPSLPAERYPGLYGARTIFNSKPSSTLRDNASSRNSQKAVFAQFSPPDQTASRMALIVDKHRPRSLDALTYHDELSERLRSLVSKRVCTD